MSRFACVMGALTLLAAPAVAQEANEDLTRNPNERVICKKEDVIGSRLASKEVCLTAREWQERKEADREQLEKIQSDTRAPRSG